MQLPSPALKLKLPANPLGYAFSQAQITGLHLGTAEGVLRACSGDQVERF